MSAAVPTRKDLLRLSKVELVKKCKSYKVSTNGSKGDMVDRILNKISKPSPKRASIKTTKTTSKKVKQPKQPKNDTIEEIKEEAKQQKQPTNNNQKEEVKEEEKKEETEQKETKQEEPKQEEATKDKVSEQQINDNTESKTEIIIPVPSKVGNIQNNDETNDKNVNSNIIINAFKTDTELKTFHFIGIRNPKKKENDEYKHSVSKLFDNVSAVSITTNLSWDSSINALKQFIKKEFDIKTDDDRIKLLILYSHCVVSDDNNSNLTFKDCGITNNSCFVVAIHDDMKQEENKEEKKDEKTDTDDDDDDEEDEKAKDKTAELIDFDADLAAFKKLMPLMPIQRGISLDVITQENNVSIFRMPFCNHSMAKESLYHYVLSQFNDKREVITCPHTKKKDKTLLDNGQQELCQQEWNYPIIKQYLICKDEAETTEIKEDDENNDFSKYAKLEMLASRNMIQNNYHLQRCSECKTLYYREKNERFKIKIKAKKAIKEIKQRKYKTKKKVKRKKAEKEVILFDDGNNRQFRTPCILCSNVFCWACSVKWNDGHLCDESFRAQTINILLTCSTKRIGEVSGVPSIRACPKCSQLITHTEGCKHMACNNCHTDFCFVCMQLRDISGDNYMDYSDSEDEDEGWPCGDSSDICPIKKRQNKDDLPKLVKNNAFQLF